MISRPSFEILRFFLVALVGLFTDLFVSWMLATYTGLILPLSAAVGFIAGAVVNYFLHEFWTFRESNSQLSMRRGALYIVVVGSTMLIRVGMVFLLERIVYSHPSDNLKVLLLATIFSFLVNYWLSKYVAFKRSADETV